GVEYMHGEDPAIKRWLQERMEAAQNTPTLSREQKLRILARLTDAETLETFLHRKYIGKKRFSLEGAESLIPLLDWLVEEFGRQDGEEIVLGMAHRGRLNVLVNVLGKGLRELFAEFEDTEIETMMGRGDGRHHPRDHQQPGGIHDESRGRALDAVRDGHRPRAAGPRLSRQRRGPGSRGLGGAARGRLPATVPAGRAHRPLQLPQVRPQRR